MCYVVTLQACAKTQLVNVVLFLIIFLHFVVSHMNKFVSCLSCYHVFWIRQACTWLEIHKTVVYMLIRGGADKDWVLVKKITKRRKRWDWYSIERILITQVNHSNFISHVHCKSKIRSNSWVFLKNKISSFSCSFSRYIVTFIKTVWLLLSCS